MHIYFSSVQLKVLDFWLSFVFFCLALCCFRCLSNSSLTCFIMKSIGNLSKWHQFFDQNKVSGRTAFFDLLLPLFPGINTSLIFLACVPSKLQLVWIYLNQLKLHNFLFFYPCNFINTSRFSSDGLNVNVKFFSAMSFNIVSISSSLSHDSVWRLWISSSKTSFTIAIASLLCNFFVFDKNLSLLHGLTFVTLKLSSINSDILVDHWTVNL